MFSSSIIVAVLTLIPFSIFLALIGLELAVSLIGNDLNKILPPLLIINHKYIMCLKQKPKGLYYL